MTEIDWDKIPKKFKWALKNSSGQLFAVTDKPVFYDDVGWTFCGDYFLIGHSSSFGWRNFLQERPSAACQEFPEHEVNEEYKVSEHDVFIKDRTVEEIAAEDARSLVDSVSELVQAYRNAVAELNMLKAKLRELSHD